MTHPDLPCFLRHLITCPPADVPGAFLVFADWLEEQRDERCGVLRKIVAKGPVEVEPVSCRTTVPGLYTWRTCDALWWLKIDQQEAAREFLHRLRVRCLILFRREICPPSFLHARDVASPLRVDPRWPPLPCPVCDATMCRCEGCGAEWCLEGGEPHRPAKFMSACPKCGESPQHWRSGVTADALVGDIVAWSQRRRLRRDTGRLRPSL